MNLQKYSPLVLRIGMAFVFLWFGFSQLKDPARWVGMLPDYITFSSLETIIYINGSLEIILAVMLLLGLYVRPVSLLMGLHLLHISFILGYGAAAIRDVSIAIGIFAVFLRGEDEFCLSKILRDKKKTTSP